MTWSWHLYHTLCTQHVDALSLTVYFPYLLACEPIHGKHAASNTGVPHDSCLLLLMLILACKPLQGKPAASIQWGAWEELAWHQMPRWWLASERAGLRMVAPTTGLAALGASHSLTQWIVIKILRLAILGCHDFEPQGGCIWS